MEVNTEQRLQNISIIRQRNFFAGCTLLAVISNFLLVAKISSTTERIIMVPGITKDLAVEGSVVSQSYLEETALLFASALLDLTADTIDAKKNIILKHASTRSDQSKVLNPCKAILLLKKMSIRNSGYQHSLRQSKCR